MVYTRNDSLAILLLVTVLLTGLTSTARAESPGSRATPAPAECQLYPEVGTFQDFFNPNDYYWQGTWAPSWNSVGVQKADRDYDRAATVPSRDNDRAVGTSCRDYDRTVDRTGEPHSCKCSQGCSQGRPVRTSLGSNGCQNVALRNGCGTTAY
jgi:hypothetical protein